MTKDILQQLSAVAEQAQSDIAKFTEDFAQNPVRALQWADRVYQAAATAWVTDQVKERICRLVEEGKTQDEARTLLRKFITDDLLKEVAALNFQSSPSANLMAQQMMSAKSKVLGLLAEAS